MKFRDIPYHISMNVETVDFIGMLRLETGSGSWINAVSLKVKWSGHCVLCLSERGELPIRQLLSDGHESWVSFLGKGPD